jgi:hypothetical protein
MRGSKVKQEKGRWDWLIKLVGFIVILPIVVIMDLCKDSRKRR